MKACLERTKINKGAGDTRLLYFTALAANDINYTSIISAARLLAQS
jgi:hypothetical protein